MEGMKAILVTTAHRGVFFGYVDEAADLGAPTIALTRARNCVYWSSDVRGFLGLAATGPSKGCRVGPAADIVLRDITSVVAVTDEARERWEGQPWSS